MKAYLEVDPLRKVPLRSRPVTMETRPTIVNQVHTWLIHKAEGK